MAAVVCVGSDNLDDKRKPKAHAIVFPYPYHGHINPTLNLALKLASHSFTVTFVLPEFIQHSQRQGGSAAVRLASISDGFPVEFDRNANFDEYWESMIRDFPARVGELVESVKESDEPETVFFLVADSLYTWPAEVAEKHNLVNVSFWTQPALVFNIGCHLDLLRQNGHYPYQGSKVEYIRYIPGVESMSTKDLMSQVQDPNAIPILDKICQMAFSQAKRAHFILHNTVQELEPLCLSSLNNHNPTYAVGPINNMQITVSSCSAWLGSKPPASVLYISLGTIFDFSKEETAEIAHALLTCRCNFLWVLRSAAKISKEEELSVLLQEAEDRGMVVPWCDQVAVLSSPAVGGFLMHCGWNSILESMWCGVPMLCHPLCVDQPTNRKLVVEDWGIGMDLCEIRREEVSRKIHGLMEGEKGVELRKEAMKVKETVRNALGRDGSSERNFLQFVHHLKERLVH